MDDDLKHAVRKLTERVGELERQMDEIANGEQDTWQRDMLDEMPMTVFCAAMICLDARSPGLVDDVRDLAMALLVDSRETLRERLPRHAVMADWSEVRARDIIDRMLPSSTT